MFDPLDELEMAIDKVAASEYSVDLERMCQLAERVEFFKFRAIRDYDRSGDWQADGFVSTAAALLQMPDAARDRATIDQPRPQTRSTPDRRGCLRRRGDQPSPTPT
jgi:hypothetical protein